MSTECKHPTHTRSLDDQDDHGPTVFDRLLFFNRSTRSKKRTSGGDSDDNRADQNIDSSGTIWSRSGRLEKTILGEIESLRTGFLCDLVYVRSGFYAIWFQYDLVSMRSDLYAIWFLYAMIYMRYGY